MIISESVPILFAKNYQNPSVLVETTACQIWRVSRHSVEIVRPIKFTSYVSRVTRGGGLPPGAADEERKTASRNII